MDKDNLSKPLNQTGDTFFASNDEKPGATNIVANGMPVITELPNQMSAQSSGLNDSCYEQPDGAIDALIDVPEELGAPVPKQCYFVRLWRTYNKSLLVALAIQFFNSGMRAMTGQAISYMFLEVYQLNPLLASQYNSDIHVVWAPKIFYGIITDCFPICGSSKRSYILIMGILQAASSFVLATFKFENAFYVMLFGMINSLV